MKQLCSVLALSLVLAAGSALAADPPKPTAKPAAMPTMDHSKMDMSGMKPADHQKMLDHAFTALDTNKDGSLSRAEFGKHHEVMRKMHEDMMSKHHDEMSKHHDMSADHHKMAADEFARLDKNRNGSLSKSEIPAGHPLAAHFSMLDANKDGILSKAEFAKHHGM